MKLIQYGQKFGHFFKFSVQSICNWYSYLKSGTVTMNFWFWPKVLCNCITLFLLLFLLGPIQRAAYTTQNTHAMRMANESKIRLLVDWYMAIIWWLISHQYFFGIDVHRHHACLKIVTTVAMTVGRKSGSKLIKQKSFQQKPLFLKTMQIIIF